MVIGGLTGGQAELCLVGPGGCLLLGGADSASFTLLSLCQTRAG